MILRDYSANRIRNRRQLARDLAIEAGNLRLRAYRIGAKLERWIDGEMQRRETGRRV